MTGYPDPKAVVQHDDSDAILPSNGGCYEKDG